MKLAPSPKICLSRGDVLGDVVETTPIINILKLLLPGCKLYYLIREEFIPLLEGHSQIDGFIIDTCRGENNDIHTLYSLSKTIKKSHFDIFIGLWEHPSYAKLSWLSRIPIRIGHGFYLINKCLYTHTQYINTLDFLLHKVEYNTSLASFFGPLPSPLPPVSLECSDKHFNDLTDQYPQLTSDYIAIHLDAGNPQRMLMEHHFIALLQTLTQENSQQIVLFARKHHQNLAKKIMDAIDNPNNILCLVPQPSLKQLKALIQHAKVLISSDSGPVHIASGFGVPVVVYYFNRIQNALHWGPWKVPHIIVSSQHNCIDVCMPTTCKKTDCREPIHIPSLVNATQLLLSGQKINQVKQKQHWLETTLTIGLFGPNADSLNAYIGDKPWKREIFNQKLTLKNVKNFISDHNINLIFYIGEDCSFLKKLTLSLGMRWASNYIHFYPKFFKIDTPYEFEAILSQLSQ